MKRRDLEIYNVFCGVDVGKEKHFCRALAPDGESELACREVAQDEAELAGLFSGLAAFGRVLVVVDQHAGFGALVVSAARAAGADVACIAPGRFAAVAALSAEGKTDASDALVLALAAIETPRLIEPVHAAATEIDDARALVRYRDAVVRERTRAYNRVHDALNRCCPPLEALLSGQSLHQMSALAVLARYGALGLRGAGRASVMRFTAGQRGLGPCAAGQAGEMWDAARSHSADLPGARVHDRVVAEGARRIIELERLEEELSDQIAELCAGIPEIALLATMPGVGRVYSRVIALEIGDVRRFGRASKLTSHCGVGKCPRESGKRRGKKPRRAYSRRLHGAVMESARIAIRKPGRDRDYFEKKLAGGMNRRQALHALATKRVTIMYAMLVNMEPYRAA